jgi:predicted nucleic acid-binding protein
VAKPGLLVDSGALIALLNRRETAHEAVKRVFDGFFGELVTTWPAVTEACHMLPDHLAPRLVAWVGSSRWRILGMDEAAPRLSDLMRKYADRPMQIADASMIWAAEDTGLHQIVTLDRADFAIYRTKTGKRLEILP